MSEKVAPIPPGHPIQIDQKAPDFSARSTQGEITLSDYRGRWLVFFSHPADFTPVCTSEFIAFQQAVDQFEKLDTALLGLSVDSLFAHLAWVKDIEQRFGITITFPIIEDISMSIARLYGMLHEGSENTATVRAVMIIDPQGYVRSVLQYPMNIGRSVAEILRLLKALQLTDAHSVTTPEGWQPGDRTLMLPPLTQAEADRRAEKDGMQSWYTTPAGDPK